MTRPQGRSAVIGIATLAFAVAAPAFAEGSYSSYFTSISVGFDSRNHYDNNFDNASTTLSVDDCTQDSWNSHGAMEWELIRHRTLLPGVSEGTRTVGCSSTRDTTSYGAQQEAWYHFEYQGTTSGVNNYFTANDFDVTW